MFDILAAPETLPFTSALAVMFLIALFEGVAVIFGAGLSNMIDSLLPDLNADIDVDVDLDADIDPGMDVDTDVHFEPAIPGDGPGILIETLSWLRFGKVPALVLLVIFLTAFGLIGLIIQQASYSATGAMLPGMLVSLPAFAGALPVVRVLGGAIARIIPKDETDAVSSDTFIGRVATLTLGNAEHGKPAQARVRDAHGKNHYIMVAPDDEEEPFSQGQEVLLVKKAGAHFLAIENTNDVMKD